MVFIAPLGAMRTEGLAVPAAWAWAPARRMTVIKEPVFMRGIVSCPAGFPGGTLVLIKGRQSAQAWRPGWAGAASAAGDGRGL